VNLLIIFIAVIAGFSAISDIFRKRCGHSLECASVSVEF